MVSALVVDLLDVGAVVDGLGAAVGRGLARVNEQESMAPPARSLEVRRYRMCR